MQQRGAGARVSEDDEGLGVQLLGSYLQAAEGEKARRQ